MAEFLDRVRFALGRGHKVHVPADFFELRRDVSGYITKANPNDALSEWLSASVTGRWKVRREPAYMGRPYALLFSNAADAVLFKLAFGDELEATYDPVGLSLMFFAQGAPEWSGV